MKKPLIKTILDYRNRQGGVNDGYSTGQNTGTRRADKYDTR